MLVVELDSASPELKQQAVRLTQRLGTYQPPDHLSAHLSKETEALLAPALARIGLPRQNVEPLRPWLLAMMITVVELQRAGYDPEYGIDRLLLGWARNRKRVVALETVEEQLGTFAGLPDAQQERFLQATLREASGAGEQVVQLFAAWRAGDTAAIESAAFKESGDPVYAPVYEALLYARNVAMAEKIGAVVTSSESHVAVGAAHLVGPRGILALLRQKGFTVRQVPHGG